MNHHPRCPSKLLAILTNIPYDSFDRAHYTPFPHRSTSGHTGFESKEVEGLEALKQRPKGRHHGGGECDDGGDLQQHCFNYKIGEMGKGRLRWRCSEALFDRLRES
jgi:hypothetical protein